MEAKSAFLHVDLQEPSVYETTFWLCLSAKSDLLIAKIALWP